MMYIQEYPGYISQVRIINSVIRLCGAKTAAPHSLITRGMHSAQIQMSSHQQADKWTHESVADAAVMC
ncbi:MAG: hypothetical protein GY801_18690 [bacterium]|nr:hypothetical protein [bacterium]